MSRVDESTVGFSLRWTVLMAAGKGPGGWTWRTGVLDGDRGRQEGPGEPREWEKEGQEWGQELETGHYLTGDEKGRRGLILYWGSRGNT